MWQTWEYGKYDRSRRSTEHHEEDWSLTDVDESWGRSFTWHDKKKVDKYTSMMKHYWSRRSLQPNLTTDSSGNVTKYTRGEERRDQRAYTWCDRDGNMVKMMTREQKYYWSWPRTNAFPDIDNGQTRLEVISCTARKLLEDHHTTAMEKLMTSQWFWTSFLCAPSMCLKRSDDGVARSSGEVER